LDDDNLQAVYALAETLERQGGDEAARQAQSLLARVQQAQPDNLAAVAAVARVAALRSDTETLSQAVERLSARSTAWPPEAKQQLAALQSAAPSDQLEAAAKVAMLTNLLVRLSEYQQGLAELKAHPPTSRNRSAVSCACLRQARLPRHRMKPWPTRLSRSKRSARERGIMRARYF
jgi:hypothetical protein